MTKTKKSEKETFGTRLKQAREKADLTQEKLGEALGVSKSQISYYEADKDAPSYDKLILAAQTLRLTPTFLLTGTEGAGGQMIGLYTLTPSTVELDTRCRIFWVDRPGDEPDADDLGDHSGNPARPC